MKSMEKLIFILLIFSSIQVGAQTLKKNHFISGLGASFDGNNEQYKDGFSYRLNSDISEEYNFFESTSVGIKGRFVLIKDIGSASEWNILAGPFLRQYLIGGLNIQAAYLFRNNFYGRNILQGSLGYSFYSGEKLIIEPYVEYGSEITNKINEDYISFGIGFRLIMDRLGLLKL